MTEEQFGSAVEIVLDYVPAAVMSPNARIHWAVKAMAVRRFRANVGWEARAQVGQRAPIEHARISYVFTARRKRDIDNLIASMKPAQDGLVDAGVIVADDSDHLEIGTVRVERGKVERTVIKIEVV